MATTAADQGTFTGRLLDVLALDGDDLAAQLTELASSAEGRAALPELWALAELSDDSAGRHKDNFAHSIRVTAQTGAGASLRVRLAALFHDVGKAPTRRIEAGKVTFHNHEAVGARLTRARLAALGLDAGFASEVTDVIAAAARIQSWEPHWGDAAVRRIVRDAGAVLDDAVRLAHADVTSRHAHVHARVHRAVDGFVAHAAEVAAADAAAAERPVLSGDDLAELGVERGPRMGELLRWLLAENRAGRLTEPADAAAAVTARLNR